MHKMMYTNASQYVSNRGGIFYYVRRVPHDVRQHYASSRISFSLRTKSLRSAARAASSVTQRLDDYWLGMQTHNAPLEIQVSKPDARFFNHVLQSTESER